jgi:hypothetical protein
MSLLVDYCSYKAAKHACENYHYSGCIPAVKNVRFGVWEDGDFIGAVVYSRSANSKIGSFVGLDQTEAVELTRVALTEHNAPVSQIVTYTMNMIQEKDSGIKLLISYADPAEGHHGGIYQAMNWLYVGTTDPGSVLIDKNGQKVHNRTVNRAKKKGFSTQEKHEKLTRKKTPGKHKYAFPFSERIKQKVEAVCKPYP